LSGQMQFGNAYRSSLCSTVAIQQSVLGDNFLQSRRFVGLGRDMNGYEKARELCWGGGGWQSEQEASSCDVILPIKSCIVELL
jgi:hypothetical protein